MGSEADPRFFADPAELREWFRKQHDRLAMQWIGYFKKATGIPSIDWPQSVDVALCFGWIDGIRKSHDVRSYKVRFTPRRKGSNWSSRNIARMKALIEEGLVEEAGLAAFAARKPTASADTAQERERVALPAEYEAAIRADAAASRHLQGTTLSYRKQASFWILSAKREETRLRRLNLLIRCSSRGEPVPPLRWTVMRKRRPR